MQETINALDRLSNTLLLAATNVGYRAELNTLLESDSERLWEDINKLTELMWLLRTNQVEIREVEPDIIPFDDIPEEWLDRCSGEGHDRTTDEDDHKSHGMISEYIAEISPYAASIDGRVTDADVEQIVNKFVEDIKLILLTRARDYVLEDLGKMGYIQEWDGVFHNAVITTGIKSAIDDIIKNK